MRSLLTMEVWSIKNCNCLTDAAMTAAAAAAVTPNKDDGRYSLLPPFFFFPPSPSPEERKDMRYELLRVEDNVMAMRFFLPIIVCRCCFFYLYTQKTHLCTTPSHNYSYVMPYRLFHNYSYFFILRILQVPT
jgi:hypothetical protein